MKGAKFRMAVLKSYYLLVQHHKPKRRNWDRLTEWCEARLTEGGPTPYPPEPLLSLSTIRVSARFQQELNSQGLTHEKVDWKGAFWELAGREQVGDGYTTHIIEKHTHATKNDQHLKVKPELLLWLVEHVR